MRWVLAVMATLLVIGVFAAGQESSRSGPAPDRAAATKRQDSIAAAQRLQTEGILVNLTPRTVRELSDREISDALAGAVGADLQEKRALVVEERSRRLDAERAEQSARLKALQRAFIFKRDEIEGGGWYTHRSQTVNNSWNRTYLRVHVSDRGQTYLASEYAGDDWIFHERIVVRIGDRILRSEVVPGYSDLNRRDNSGGTVWETIHFTGGKDNGILQAIAQATDETIRVRFEGDQSIKDIILTVRDRKAIKDGFELGRLLRGEIVP